MAISLPPPIEPQLEPVAEVRPGANLRIDIGPARFLVADRCGLGGKRIGAAAQTATTAGEFIRGLGDACYAAGYPAERTAYAVEGTTVYVSVQRGHIQSVVAPTKLRAYFAGLESARVTRQSALELSRALADSLSERAGENYALRLEPIGHESARLVVDGPTPGRHQTQAKAEFLTSGNRYSGRYLADTELRHSWSEGSELALGGVVGVRPPALRNDSSGGPYHEGNGAYSRVTPFGVFGADGRYVDFSPIAQAVFADGSLSNVTLKGHISEGALSWIAALYANYNQRVTLTLRVARAEEIVSYQGQRQLTERYTKADATIASASRFTIAGSDVFELQSALDLGHGFTESPFGPDDNDGRGTYSVARPALRLTYGPAAQWTPVLLATAQFASATLPQLENYVLGGDTLRAFESGTAAGDRGYGARLAVKHAWLAWDWFSVQPALFAEYGAARFRDAPTGLSAGTTRRADVGFEASLRFGPYVELNVYAAEPVKRSGPEVIDDDVQRLGARLTVSY